MSRCGKRRKLAKALLTDEKWNRINHLFPPPPPRPKGGRKHVESRRVLTGILFILRTGIIWQELPLEMGCGSGMTARRRVLE
jgi:transposase